MQGLSRHKTIRIQMAREETGPAAAAAESAAFFKQSWKGEEPDLIAVAPGRQAPSAFYSSLHLATFPDFTSYSNTLTNVSLNRFCTVRISLIQ